MKITQADIAEVKRVMDAFDSRQPLPRDGDGPTIEDSGYFPFAAGYMHGTLSGLLMLLEAGHEE